MINFEIMSTSIFSRRYFQGIRRRICKRKYEKMHAAAENAVKLRFLFCSNNDKSALELRSTCCSPRIYWGRTEKRNRSERAEAIETNPQSLIRALFLKWCTVFQNIHFNRKLLKMFRKNLGNFCTTRELRIPVSPAKLREDVNQN